MKKVPVVGHIVLCCMAALLCGCTKQTSVPVKPVSSSAPEVSNSVSTMEKMELSEMEQFCLSAFSSLNDENAVYKIQLADGDSYTSFIATLYCFQDGSWIKKYPFQADIKSSVSYFAIDYHDLSLPNMAFKSGSTCRSNSSSASDMQSLFTEGYSWDTDVQESLPITGDETPLVAYRRFELNGEEKKASLKDYFSPETIPADEIEEYYLLTIAFTK